MCLLIAFHTTTSCSVCIAITCQILHWGRVISAKSNIINFMLIFIWCWNFKRLWVRLYILTYNMFMYEHVTYSLILEILRLLKLSLKKLNKFAYKLHYAFSIYYNFYHFAFFINIFMKINYIGIYIISDDDTKVTDFNQKWVLSMDALGFNQFACISSLVCIKIQGSFIPFPISHVHTLETLWKSETNQINHYYESPITASNTIYRVCHFASWKLITFSNAVLYLPSRIDRYLFYKIYLQFLQYLFI